MNWQARCETIAPGFIYAYGNNRSPKLPFGSLRQDPRPHLLLEVSHIGVFVTNSNKTT